MFTNRYNMQLPLPFVKKEGQEKLKKTHVTVIGAGGLGSPVLYYMAAAGIGKITIIDSDIVEESNFNRQFIHFENDLGKNKVDSAAEKLRLFNSEIEISAKKMCIDDNNVSKFAAQSDIIISCVDNVKSRQIINRACMKHGIPMIDGGIDGLTGYALTFIPGETACYNCIYNRAEDFIPETYTIGAAAGVIGSLMAAQAIKTLLGMEIKTNLIYINLESNEFTGMSVKPNPKCEVCSRINKQAK